MTQVGPMVHRSRATFPWQYHSTGCFELQELQPTGLADDIGRYGLPGAAEHVIEIDDWEQLLSTAASARFLGLLNHLIAMGCCRGDLSGHPHLVEQLRMRLVADLTAERRMLEVTAALCAADVTFLVFKGAAAAHVLEGDPSWRHFDDLDILVPAHALQQAYQVLCQLGADRLYPELRVGFDDRFGKGATFSSDSTGPVDVHRMPATGWIGAALAKVDYFSDPSYFQLGSRSVPTLSPLHVALVYGVRVVAGDQITSSRALRDAVLAWSCPTIDVAELIELASSIGLAACMAMSVRLAAGRFALDRTDELTLWAASYVPTARELRRLQPYSWRGWSYVRQLMMQTSELDSLSDRASFLVALALPGNGSGRAPTTRRGIDFVKGLAKEPR